MNRFLKHLFAAWVLFVLITCCRPVPAQAAPAMGIDVSAWQGSIDWNAVKNSGVTFAMVRLGNVPYGIDEKAVQNALGAAAAGLRVGAYVFTYATTPEEAAADAALAINLMANLPISFPVAVDIESDSQKRMNAADLAAIANVFSTMIYQAGYTPMVYSNKSLLTDKLHIVPWDVWVAQYADACDYRYPYAMWQASCTGKIAGIDGPVDINYLLKDYFTLIIPEGLVTVGPRTYGYKNFRRQFGFQTIGGVTYFFDTDGVMLRDKTIQDAAGNITRICRDGHVVMITAQMQIDAANAQAQYQLAQAATAAAAAASNDYAGQREAAQADYLAWEAQVNLLSASAADAQAKAQALPTPELVQAAANAKLLLDQAVIAKDLSWKNFVQATANDETAKQAVLTAQTAEGQAKLAAEAALALIQIPQ